MTEPEDLTLRMLREIRREQDGVCQDNRATTVLLMLLAREVRRLAVKIDQGFGELRVVAARAAVSTVSDA